MICRGAGTVTARPYAANNANRRAARTPFIVRPTTDTRRFDSPMPGERTNNGQIGMTATACSGRRGAIAERGNNARWFVRAPTCLPWYGHAPKDRRRSGLTTQGAGPFVSMFIETPITKIGRTIGWTGAGYLPVILVVMRN